MIDISTGLGKKNEGRKGKIYFLSSIENHYLLSSAFLHKTSISFSLFKSISIYSSIYLCTLGEGLLIYKKFYLKIGFYFFMTLYILGVPGADASYCCLPLFYAKILGNDTTILFFQKLSSTWIPYMNFHFCQMFLNDPFSVSYFNKFNVIIKKKWYNKVGLYMSITSVRNESHSTIFNPQVQMAIQRLINES